MATNSEPVKVNDTKQDTYGESNVFAIRSIQYPPMSDPSNSGNNQRHFVRFTINVDEDSRLIKRKRVESTKVDQTDQNRLRTGNISQERADVLGGAALASIAVGSGTTAAVLTKLKGFPAKAAIAGGAGAIGAFAGYKIAESFNLTKKIRKLAASITLYNPGNNTATYDIGYDSTDTQIQNILQNERGAELLKDLDNAEKSPSYLTAAGKLAKVVAIGGSDLLQSMTRSTLNKKQDLLFKQVNRRTFQFEYRFMPKNEFEAYDIANIIYMFKYFQHPEMLEGYDQFLYIYPAEFDIEYIYKAAGNEAENIWLNKISSCVLESMSVNYGGNGTFQSLVSGEPVETNLVLRFREIETLHQGRIADGL
jgi:hypothetical protein